MGVPGLPGRGDGSSHAATDGVYSSDQSKPNSHSFLIRVERPRSYDLGFPTKPKKDIHHVATVKDSAQVIPRLIVLTPGRGT